MAYADVINSQSPILYNNGSATFDTLPGGVAGSKIDTGFNVAPYVNNAYGTIYGPSNVSAFSLSFYLKVGGVTGTQVYTLARFTQVGTQKFRVVAVGKSGNFDLAVIDYNGTQINLVTNADPNAWYHIAIRRTTTTSSTYDAFVNGVKVIAAATMGNWTSTTWNIQIGMYGTGYDYNKSFDEVAAFTNILTDQQIADQYTAGNAPTTYGATVTSTPATSSLLAVPADAYTGNRTTPSGYRDLILGASMPTAYFYNDGLSMTNLGSQGGTWGAGGYGTIATQKDGKFTGGLAGVFS